MSRSAVGEDIILYMEQYSPQGKELHEALQRAGYSCLVIVLEEDGFCPEGLMSAYEYFIEKQNQEKHVERELHYNFIKVPEFWEIRTNGAIYNMGAKKASIYCREPIVKGVVQRVEWMMEDGWIYRIDYYNKYGLKYASEFLDRDHKTESKVYYSDRQQEVLVEQPQNDTVMLFENGRMKAFFASRAEFLLNFFEMLQSDGKCIVFQEKSLFDKFIEAGVRNCIWLPEVPVCYPANQARGEVLILTASDKIEGIRELIEKLPHVNFHIAAHTQVSDSLLDLQKWKNVKVYPQVGAVELEFLWEKCDFYFDINYYREIYDAVNQASQKNLLIMGFEDTLHNRGLVSDDCIFPRKNWEKMADIVGKLAGHPDMVRTQLEKQQGKRLENWNKLRQLLDFLGN